MPAIAQPISIEHRWEPCHIDDLQCVLNVVQVNDLIDMLGRTPAPHRMAVAKAFVWGDSATDTHLIVAIDLAPAPVPGATPRGQRPHAALNAARVSMTRWLSRTHAMPLGIGVRLAKAFGVPCLLLCESYTGGTVGST